MSLPDLPKLELYLKERLGAESLTIKSFWKNLEGWSMETFSLGLEYRKDSRDVKQDVIIRKEPMSGLLEPYDVSIEYRVLSALQNSGIAIPKTYWYEKDPSVLGLPFYVMEKVEGVVHFYSTSRVGDPTFKLIPDDAERASLSDDFVKNIALIHKVDWKALGLDFLGDPGLGKGSAEHAVQFWNEMISRAGFGRKPVVVYAKHWLMDNLPDNEPVALVHGDYRTGNYIARDNRIAAILDWEMVHLGDPMEDISYIISSIWRSARPNHWISHLMPLEEFYEKYHKQTGIKIDLDKIKYYHMLNSFKAVGIGVTAANAFRAKPNPELKIGVFGMTIYAQFFNLILTLNKYVAPKKGAA